MFVFPVILGGIILLGSTIAVLRLSRKRGAGKPAQAGIVAISLILFFLLFKGVYRPYALYERHYTLATHTEIPGSAEFEFADMWNGNEENAAYSSVSVISMSPEDLSALHSTLLANEYQELSEGLKKYPTVLERVNYARSFTEGLMIDRVWIKMENDLVKYAVAYLNDNGSIILYVWK
jgi:hypothetical protein